MSRSLRLLSFVLACVAVSAPAQADLTICNKTPASINVAVAFETSQDLVSQGWWTLDPDQCEKTIAVPLDHQYYYHYAISNAPKVEWAGNVNFCTSDDPQFRVIGAQGCEQRNYHTVGFRQTDVGTNKDYTLNIRSAEPPKTEATPAAPAAVATPAVTAPAATAPAVTAPPAATAPVTTPPAQ